MGKYILALDQGTTSSRAIIFNQEAKIVGQHNVEFPQIFPQPGWVEHNPLDINQSLMDSVYKVIKDQHINCDEIDSIGITNQRETAVLWDRKTGKPVHNAIVWQCRRTSGRCGEIKQSDFVDTIFNKTGLVVDPYFSATKIEYILKNNKDIYDKAKNGQIAFGTVDSWIIYNLTKGKYHVTDYSNAARTMLFNINTLQWDDEILEFFGIPKSILPEVVPNSFNEIKTESSLFEGCAIPITGIAGDQQSALFGQCCFNEGEIKNTYGTGCFLLMNVGKEPIYSKNKLLTTIGWNINGETFYALEGAVFIAGAVVQWLRDALKIISDSAETEAIAMNNSKESVMLVPAFSGLGSPHWDPEVRGAVFGLTRDSDRADFIKAALESIAFQSKDLLEAMKTDAGEKVEVFKADGGASKNKYLMQFQADILQEDIFAAKMAETTGLGAAYLAGLATGFFESQEALKKLNKEVIEFKPQISPDKAAEKYNKWKIAVEAAKKYKI
ncbi:MAG: glycerol kinase GlpK [Spirochaetes bacterium]|nr:glycerol kinase GlpK [Spirochaetota bacterium]